jgi:hypothetical protein
MQTTVNANRVTSLSRKVTAESRFVILALIHDGFALKIYKSSSAEATEQVAIQNNV